MRPPEDWSRARLTLGLAAAIAAAWAFAALFGLQGPAVQWASFMPADVGYDIGGARAPLWLTPLTATLVHAGPFHLAFNLLILVFCGRPTEAVLGPAGLAVLYVVGAYAAAAGHYLVDPEDLTPMVGASGAVSAVLGAYAMLFGRNKVKTGNPKLALWLNALWLMAAWVALNLLIGYLGATINLGIAFAAHIGGFLAGLLLATPLLLLRYRDA